MFVTVKLKQIVLWKTRCFMPLMRIDKLLHGNCSSNVNADSLSSTQMETLLWLYGNELSKCLLECIALNLIKYLAPFRFSRRRLATNHTVLETHYCFFFPQGKQQLSVSSIVSGIMTQLATWTQRQHSPSAWLWRDRHLSPSVSTKLLCLFKHFLN